jgi:predicted nucleic acid-binding protein
MKYVFDSSVAFKWLVPEADTAKALSLRDDFRKAVHELIAPDILPVETTHALTRAERQKRISPAQGAVPTTTATRCPNRGRLINERNLGDPLGVGRVAR